jgi:hypothetical protein
MRLDGATFHLTATRLELLVGDPATSLMRELAKEDPPLDLSKEWLIRLWEPGHEHGQPPIGSVAVDEPADGFEQLGHLASKWMRDQG